MNFSTLKRKIAPGILSLTLAVTAFSCESYNEDLPEAAIKGETSFNKSNPMISDEVTMDNWDNLISSTNMTGSILVYNPQNNRSYSNDFGDVDTRYASGKTALMPTVLTAIEIGLAEDGQTTIEQSSNSLVTNSPRNLSLDKIYLGTCSPCMQVLAEEIGVSNLDTYMNNFGFGEPDIDANNLFSWAIDPNNGISPREQVMFLSNLKNQTLSADMMSMVNTMRIIDRDVVNNYQMKGHSSVTVAGSTMFAWDVNLVEHKGEYYYVAMYLEPTQTMSPDAIMSTVQSLQNEVLGEIIQ